MRIRLSLIPMGVLGFCAAMYGQSGAVSGSVATSAGVARGSISFSGPRTFPLHPVTGAPYSAEQVTERVQTLADGTHIRDNMRSEKIYRDSQGRTRTERPMIMSRNGQDSPILVEITDPVAGVGYTLDAQNKIAHRVTYPKEEPRRETAMAGVGAGGGVTGSEGGAASRVMTPRSRMPRPDITTEKLGTQVIEGVTAEGRRNTQTWGVDTQGNDRPIVVTNETWMSPELQVVVLLKSNDPRSGETTTKLINISRSEPDFNLFVAPPDYKIVDETGPYRIEWTETRQ